MLGKNNQQELLKRQAQKVQNFGIRKFSVGVASVIVATSLFFSTNNVIVNAQVDFDGLINNVINENYRLEVNTLNDYYVVDLGNFSDFSTAEESVHNFLNNRYLSDFSVSFDANSSTFYAFENTPTVTPIEVDEPIKPENPNVTQQAIKKQKYALNVQFLDGDRYEVVLGEFSSGAEAEVIARDFVTRRQPGNFNWSYNEDTQTFKITEINQQIEPLQPSEPDLPEVDTLNVLKTETIKKIDKLELLSSEQKKVYQNNVKKADNEQLIKDILVVATVEDDMLRKAVLEELKKEIKNKIGLLEKLTSKQKDDFVSEIDLALDTNDIELILEKAVAFNDKLKNDDLQELKEEVIAKISQLEFLTSKQKEIYQNNVNKAVDEQLIRDILVVATVENDQKANEKQLIVLKADVIEIIKKLANLTEDDKTELIDQIQMAKNKIEVDQIKIAAEKLDEERAQQIVNNQLLEKARIEAKEAIHSLKRLSNEEKLSYYDQLDESSTVEQINKIKNKALEINHQKHDEILKEAKSTAHETINQLEYLSLSRKNAYLGNLNSETQNEFYISRMVKFAVEENEVKKESITIIEAFKNLSIERKQALVEELKSIKKENIDQFIEKAIKENDANEKIVLPKISISGKREIEDESTIRAIDYIGNLNEFPEGTSFVFYDYQTKESHETMTLSVAPNPQSRNQYLVIRAINEKADKPSDSSRFTIIINKAKVAEEKKTVPAPIDESLPLPTLESAPVAYGDVKNSTLEQRKFVFTGSEGTQILLVGPNGEELTQRINFRGVAEIYLSQYNGHLYTGDLFKAYIYNDNKMSQSLEIKIEGDEGESRPENVSGYKGLEKARFAFVPTTKSTYLKVMSKAFNTIVAKLPDGSTQTVVTNSIGQAVINLSEPMKYTDEFVIADVYDREGNFWMTIKSSPVFRGTVRPE